MVGLNMNMKILNYLIYFFLFCLSLNIVFAVDVTLKDYYTSSDSGYTSADRFMGQTWDTTIDGYSLLTYSLNFYDSNAAGGCIGRLMLREVNVGAGGVPELTNLSISELTAIPTSSQWVNFTFLTPYTVLAGHDYAIVLDTQAGGSCGHNIIYRYKDLVGSGHGRNTLDQTAGWTWNARQGDFITFTTLPLPGLDNLTKVNITYPEENYIFNASTIAAANHNISVDVWRNTTNASCFLNDTRFSYSYNDTWKYYFNNNTVLNNDRYDILAQCNTTSLYSNATNTTYFYINTFDLVGVNYSNYLIYSSKNYTRDLTYNVYYTCSNNRGNISLLINGTLNQTLTADCSGSTILNNISGTKSDIMPEGDFNIQFRLNDYGRTELSGNVSFISDQNAPIVTAMGIYPGVGFNAANSNFSLQCTDTAFNNLNYTIIVNAAIVNYSNFTSGKNLTQAATFNNGLNTLTGRCGDLFGNSSDSSVYTTIYFKQLALIDEGTGGSFDLANVSNLTVYYDDNRSKYGFKDENKAYVNFTGSGNNTKLRVEIKYSNGDIITRYVDISIDEGDEDLRICVNKDDITHYEQIITGSTIRAVTVKSVYANCVVGQDYTRFVYENNLILKVYTRNTLYYLYAYDDDGVKTYLSSMDGSFSTYYNVDVLEFNKGGYNLVVPGESIGVSKYSNQTLRIYYLNMDNDSVSTKLTITQVNTSVTYFTVTETAQPNRIELLFDYSTLGLDETSLFKIEVEKTTAEGVVTTKEKLFNLAAKAGTITNGFAVVIAILLTIFGLTFTIKSISLGWFGILVQIGSIAVLSMAIGNIYTPWIMAINLIVLIFIIILLMEKNYEAVG